MNISFSIGNVFESKLLATIETVLYDFIMALQQLY